jgi:DNA-binding LacI/PurR family transcriptional regulator/anti-anti-sigma regulatory factor
MADTRIIGLLSPSLSDEFNVLTASGVHAVAREHSHHVVAIEAAPALVSTLGIATQEVAGWIAVLNAEGIEALAPEGTPAVLISTPGAHARYPLVQPDNRPSARTLVQHLIDHGHRRIAFVGCLFNMDIGERAQIYQDTLRANGIEPDPALLVAVDDYAPTSGEAAVRALLRDGLPCSAIVFGNDEHALAGLDVITGFGHRVPEDVAIVGFDDIESAQYAATPLTTARLPSADMGRQAAQILFAQLAGQPVPPLTLVPTIPILRRSCGCQQMVAPAEQTASASDWTTTLAGRLVQVLRYPLPPDPELEPTSVWPGVATLIDGLAAAAAGTPGPDQPALELAWQEVFALQGKADTMLQLNRELEDAVLRHPAADEGAALRIRAFLDTSQIVMVRALLTTQRQEVSSMSRLLWANYELGLMLVASPGKVKAGSKLRWMERMPIELGCLARWDAGASGTLIIDSIYVRGSQAPLEVGQRYAAPAFPPPALLAAAAGAGKSAYLVVVPIQTEGRHWGALVFGNPFVDRALMGITTTGMWAMLLGGAFEREALEAAVVQERAMLQEAFDRERQLADTVRDLGCPLLPLLPRVLLVPLIGAIDAARAQYILTTVLYGISAERAEHVLLDITGVAMIDEQVAGALMQIASASALLGARVALVGVRPEIAQHIASLGMDLRWLVTHPTLATAVQTLLRQ